MKLAVTDACIFIDLIELQMTSEFFDLDIEIHTSLDVFNELYAHQKELLKAYRSGGKLFIHNLNSESKSEIQSIKYPRVLSEPDKTVLYLAEKVNAMVISSDKAVRSYAKARAIEYHGMLWIFDQLINTELISPEIALDKITWLINNNIVYQNNAELSKEIQKRISIWNNREY